MDINPNLLGWVIVSLAQAFTAWMAWKTKTAAEKTEVNTNSMREQLVAATGVSAHAAGMEEGRITEIARVATLAEGKSER